MPMSRLARRFWLGIEHLAALDHEIELVVRPHGGERGRGCDATEAASARPDAE